MLENTAIDQLTGATVFGNNGEKIGKVRDVYLDDATNRPEWLAVSTGWFGSNISFVPLRAAEMRGTDEVVVPYDKGMIKDSPNYDADAHLSPEEETQLYRYYGVDAGAGWDTMGTDTTRTTGTAMTTGTAGTARTDTDLRDTRGTRETAGTRGTTDDAMTRSEERLHVGTERVETGRARLRKYVVTENVQQTVPVRHEEVRIEREPISDANRDEAMRGPDITESEHEVTLTEERPVVAKETVPVERVRLAKETVTGEETVGDEVRKEQIDTEGVYPDDTRITDRERSDR